MIALRAQCTFGVANAYTNFTRLVFAEGGKAAGVSKQYNPPRSGALGGVP